jgi:hypothetical protein
MRETDTFLTFTTKNTKSRKISMTGWFQKRLPTLASMPSGRSQVMRSCALSWPFRKADTTTELYLFAVSLSKNEPRTGEPRRSKLDAFHVALPIQELLFGGMHLLNCGEILTEDFINNNNK